MEQEAKHLWIFFNVIIVAAGMGRGQIGVMVVLLLILNGFFLYKFFIAPAVTEDKKASLDGAYTIPVGRNMKVEITYRGLTHSWDIDYFGPNDGGEDIWSSLDDEQKSRLYFDINDYTSELREKAGIKGV